MTVRRDMPGVFRFQNSLKPREESSSGTLRRLRPETDHFEPSKNYNLIQHCFSDGERAGYVDCISKPYHRIQEHEERLIRELVAFDPCPSVRLLALRAIASAPQRADAGLFRKILLAQPQANGFCLSSDEKKLALFGLALLAAQKMDLIESGASLALISEMGESVGPRSVRDFAHALKPWIEAGQSGTALKALSDLKFDSRVTAMGPVQYDRARLKLLAEAQKTLATSPYGLKRLDYLKASGTPVQVDGSLKGSYFKGRAIFLCAPNAEILAHEATHAEAQFFPERFGLPSSVDPLYATKSQWLNACAANESNAYLTSLLIDLEMDRLALGGPGLHPSLDKAVEAYHREGPIAFRETLKNEIISGNFHRESYLDLFTIQYQRWAPVRQFERLRLRTDPPHQDKLSAVDGWTSI